jgi:carbohydrate diacid regulator
MVKGVITSQEVVSSQLIYAIVESVISKINSHADLPASYPSKSQFIRDLLQEQIEDENLAVQRAEVFGVDLNPPRAVILVDAANYILESVDVTEASAQYAQRSQQTINSIVNFFHLPNDTICTDLGAGIICVLKASDTKNLDLWVNREEQEKRSDAAWANLTALKRAAHALDLRLQRDLSHRTKIGVGRYYPGIKGLARSYKDACAALSLGSRLQKSKSVHCLSELGIAAFVSIADETTKVELAQYLLSPLDDEPDLITTIKTFFAENCCSSASAKQLYIHRNTLNYRLDKIASLTGLDPRNFDDAVQIRISLLLRSLSTKP